MAESAGGIYYEIDIETKQMIESSEKAKAELNSLTKSVQKISPDFDKLSNSAKGVASALAMPEVNKLSASLAQLSGKIGASSEAANAGAVANTKFSGALSTVAGKLGAGYVTNVGSATASLVKNAKAALNATSAQVENAIAAQKEATALQGAASALVLKAAGEKKLAESAAQAAASDLAAAEAVFERKTAEISSLEVLLTRQRESLKQAEANLTVSNSEKAVAAAVRARSAVDATAAKVQRQSNQAVKEVTAAEDKAKAAKEALASANTKLTAAIDLEAAALATSAKANDAATIAAERHTLATKAQAVAVSGARSALSLLGGPSGILLLAAAGVYSLYQAMSDNQDIEQFKRDIDEAAKRVEYLTQVQAKAAATKISIAIKTDKNELDGINRRLSDVNAQLRYMKGNESEWRRINPLRDYNKTLDSLKNKLALLDNEQEKLNDSIQRNNALLDTFGQRAEKAGNASAGAARANEIYDSSVKSLTTSNSLLEKAINESLSAAEEWAAKSQLEKALSDAGISAKDAAVQVAKLHDEFERKRSLTFEQMLKQTEQNVAVLKKEMQEGAEAAAAYRAQLQAGEMGITDEGKINKLIDAARERVRLQKQLSEQKREQKTATKTTDEAARAIGNLKRQLGAVNLQYEDNSREAAVFNAVQALGKKATAEQRAEVERLAGALFDAKQKKEDLNAAIQNDPVRKENKSYTDAVEQLKRQFDGEIIDRQAYNQQSELLEQQHQANLAKIRAQQTVSPTQEAQGQIDPVQQLANQHAQELALIQQFESQKGQLTQRGLELTNAANRKYEQERIAAQWEIFRSQNAGTEALAASIDALAGNASNALTGIITGSMTASDAMRSLGSTVLNSLVNTFVQIGVDWVKSAIMGSAAQTSAIGTVTAVQTAATGVQTATSVAAAGTVAAAWTPAAILSSIASMGTAAAIGLGAVAGVIGANLLGKRKNGGPVSAGGMYQVGEGGMPEIYKASNGSQYMIPGDNGKVISNKDMQGNGGNMRVTHNVYNYASGVQVDTQSSQNNGELLVETFITDLQNGGPMSSQMQQSFGLRRQATGAY